MRWTPPEHRKKGRQGLGTFSTLLTCAAAAGFLAASPPAGECWECDTCVTEVYDGVVSPAGGNSSEAKALLSDQCRNFTFADEQMCLQALDELEVSQHQQQGVAC